jgi:CheY-like chemotaxis protein
MLHLSVTDTGIGISDDQIAMIFDRFTQADSSITRKFGGSGLGLSIVKGLVDAMTGRIDVVSEVSVGSCFNVHIPVQRVASGPQAEATAGRQARRPVAARPVRVLVAEDNVLNADTLRLLLDRRGVVASIARNGEEALKLFQPGHFDLVLMDIQMPVLDGESALKGIRKLEAALGRTNTVVIACTAYVDPDSRARYQRLGFDHVVAKPIDVKEIDGLVGLAAKRIEGRSDQPD